MNERLEYIIILLLIMLLIVSMFTLNRSNNVCTSENFYAKKKDALTKKELSEQVTKIFNDISEEDKRHTTEINKLREKLKAILTLSLDPKTQLENVPKKVKREDICLFNVGGQLKKIKEMYNKYKNNPNFELVQVYERPILGQAKDYKDKKKTYGYVYVDHTLSNSSTNWAGYVSRIEKYGNMTLLFNNKCKVVEMMSLKENMNKDKSTMGDDDDED